MFVVVDDDEVACFAVVVVVAVVVAGGWCGWCSWCVCVLFGLWVVFVVCFGGWLVLFSKREGRVSDTQNWVVIMFQLIRSWKRPKMGLTHPRIIPMVIYHDISWYIYTSVYLPIIYILYMYMFAIINVIIFLKYNLSILYMPYIIIYIYYPHNIWLVKNCPCCLLRSGIAPRSSQVIRHTAGTVTGLQLTAAWGGTWPVRFVQMLCTKKGKRFIIEYIILNVYIHIV